MVLIHKAVKHIFNKMYHQKYITEHIDRSL